MVRFWVLYMYARLVGFVGFWRAAALSRVGRMHRRDVIGGICEKGDAFSYPATNGLAATIQSLLGARSDGPIRLGTDELSASL
jgi:hypothetical protein